MLALVAAVRVYRLKHGSKLLSWGDFRQDFPQDPKIAQTITALLPLPGFASSAENAEGSKFENHPPKCLA